MMLKTADGLNKAYEMLQPASSANLIFDFFKAPDGDHASIIKLLKVLKSFGLREKDPRLKEMMTRIQKIEDSRETGHSGGFHLRRHTFRE
ncbi:hypothetical protein COOONC_14465 [Cooperia oncophora]